jgi:hypothetical protein
MAKRAGLFTPECAVAKVACRLAALVMICSNPGKTFVW